MESLEQLIKFLENIHTRKVSDKVDCVVLANDLRDIQSRVQNLLFRIQGEEL